MVRFTIVIPKQLDTWLMFQANLRFMSKTRFILLLLEKLKQESDTKNLLDIE